MPLSISAVTPVAFLLPRKAYYEIGARIAHLAALVKGAALSRKDRLQPPTTRAPKAFPLALSRAGKT